MPTFKTLIVFALFTHLITSWYSFKVDLTIQTSGSTQQCKEDNSQDCETYSSKLTLSSEKNKQIKNAFAERPAGADSKLDKTKVIEFDFQKSKAFFFSQNNNFFAPTDGTPFTKQIIFNSFSELCNLDSAVSSRIAEDKVFITVFLDCVPKSTSETLDLKSFQSAPDDVKPPKGHEELDTTALPKRKIENASPEHFSFRRRQLLI